MATAQFVDDLGTSYTETLGDLVGSDEIVLVNLALQGPVLESRCPEVVYARAHVDFVSTNNYA